MQILILYAVSQQRSMSRLRGHRAATIDSLYTFRVIVSGIMVWEGEGNTG